MLCTIFFSAGNHGDSSLERKAKAAGRCETEEAIQAQQIQHFYIIKALHRRATLLLFITLIQPGKLRTDTHDDLFCARTYPVR